MAIGSTPEIGTPRRLRVTDIQNFGLQIAKEEWGRRNQGETKPFWPDRFCSDDPATAWKFVQECWTWNESAGALQGMPKLEYLEAYCYQWYGAKASGKTLITEKCRRMVISWCARGLELHQMGLGRCDQILGGEDFEAAAKHVWRLKHLYCDLQNRHPDWKLPPHSELKYEGDRKLKAFGLPNGSLCNYANGQSGGLQGEGVKIITLEEAGLYRYLSSMLAQAKIIKMGTATAVGGFVNLISNTPPMDSPGAYAWSQIKKGMVPCG